MKEIKEFTTFLKEVFPNPATIEALGRLCADAIFRSTESKRAICLHGDGANGKSVFTTSIQQIIPSTSLFIHELATTKPLSVRVFNTPLVIIYYDYELPKKQRRLACQNIMNILLQNEIKGVYSKLYNPVPFKPNCRLLFISNTPPAWSEGFEMLHELILSIEMPKRFLPDEADPDLKDSYRKLRLDTFDWICSAARKKMETGG